MRELILTLSMVALPAPAIAADFWSLRPPQRQAAPEVRDADRVAQPTDSFILAALEEAGGAFAEPAPARVLMRRLSFDLTGLPPSPADAEAFASDADPDALHKRVDRLLASPHFGERRARPWLDLARYAEDQAHLVGNNTSLFYPNAFLYRDWVIDAFNAGMPYDRFVKLQLAGDLIEPEDDTHAPALGFIGLGPKYYSRNNPAVMADEWEDRVDVVTRGLLGLTAACARCHDHKYDPIPTADYYALAGVFAGTEMFNRPLPGTTDLDPKGGAKNPAEAMHVIRDGKPTDLNVYLRGDVKAKGPVVPRRFLTALSGGEPEPFGEGSGRRELAEAIASPANPLTARVIVNRLWGDLFGKPIVATPSNFGALGQRPTHPELLDDLAVRFVADGWDVKRLVREWVTSSTYQQASGVDPADPANRLLGLMNRKRLDAETWRDAILSASGRLGRTIGGPSIDPEDGTERRRTVYSRVSRLKLAPMLAMFDVPDPNVHADQRAETTTPLQKLFVLNSPFMVSQAEALAGRCLSAADDDAGRIGLAYRWLFGRDADSAEYELGLAFLSAGDDHAGRWRSYAQVLLASNEMMFVD